jgi:curli biogenesis system outer membrane secretion channel CsgG
MIKKLMLFAVLLSLTAFAAEKQAKYNTAEPKHFAKAEGVELSSEFPEFLYAALTAELKKSKMFKEVIGEGEVVDAADAANSFRIDGEITEYKKGSVAKEVLIGFGTGRRVLKAHIKIVRLSDKAVVFDKEMQVKATSRWDENLLARFLANKIVGEMKHTSFTKA